MVMLKVYRLIDDFMLSTPIVVEEKTVNVVFSGGSKAMRQNGEFVTADERLQEAIEKSSGYGKVYKLVKTYGEKVEVRSEPEPEREEKVCGTVNEAVEWLVGLGCKKSEVNTSVKAIAAAKELGYTLIFEKGE